MACLGLLQHPDMALHWDRKTHPPLRLRALWAGDPCGNRRIFARLCGLPRNPDRHGSEMRSFTMYIYIYMYIYVYIYINIYICTYSTYLIKNIWMLFFGINWEMQPETQVPLRHSIIPSSRTRWVLGAGSSGCGCSCFCGSQPSRPWQNRGNNLKNIGNTNYNRDRMEM